MAKQANIDEIGRAIRREVGGFEKATEQELRNLWGTFTDSRRGRMLAAIAEGDPPKRQRRAKQTPPAASDAGAESNTEAGDQEDESTSTVSDGPVQADTGD